MARGWIVWNPGRSEGVIFMDEPTTPGFPSAAQDAQQASTGKSAIRGVGSALAEHFFESYGEDADDPLPIEAVDL